MAWRSKNILVLVLFLFVAGNNMVRAFTVRPVLAAQKDHGISRPLEHPNAEAETYHLALSASCYLPFVKYVTRAEMQSACSLTVPAMVWQAIHRKRSSQLVKDYLLHIYPSHNFW